MNRSILMTAMVLATISQARSQPKEGSQPVRLGGGALISKVDLPRLFEGTNPVAAQSAAEEAPNTSVVDALFRPTSSIRVDPTITDQKVPVNKAAGRQTRPTLYVVRQVHPNTTPLRYPVRSLHNPLYFEEPNLERCGNGCGCFTSTVSAVHFLSGTILLPYRLVSEPPCSTQCAMGDCRCNQKMPCQSPLRCKIDAALSEGAAAAGFAFLLL